MVARRRLAGAARAGGRAAGGPRDRPGRRAGPAGPRAVRGRHRPPLRPRPGAWHPARRAVRHRAGRRARPGRHHDRPTADPPSSSPASPSWPGATTCAPCSPSPPARPSPRSSRRSTSWRAPAAGSSSTSSPGRDTATAVDETVVELGERLGYVRVAARALPHDRTPPACWPRSPHRCPSRSAAVAGPHPTRHRADPEGAPTRRAAARSPACPRCAARSTPCCATPRPPPHRDVRTDPRAMTPAP